MKTDGTLEVIAPHGLGDLFSLTVRHNPVRATLETYCQRIAEKDFQRRWPRVSIRREKDVVPGV